MIYDITERSADFCFTIGFFDIGQRLDDMRCFCISIFLPRAWYLGVGFGLFMELCFYDDLLDLDPVSLRIPPPFLRAEDQCGRLVRFMVFPSCSFVVMPFE